MEQMVWMLSGIICGVAVFLRLLRKRKYIPVEAICTNMYVKRVNRGGFFLTRGKGTFSYRVNGKSYTYEDPGFVNTPKIKQGAKCVLRVHPQTPQTVLPPSYDNMTGSLALLACLLLAMAAV